MEETIYSKQRKERGKRLLRNITNDIEESDLPSEEKQQLLKFKVFKEGQGREPQTIEKLLRVLLYMRVGSKYEGKKTLAKPLIKTPYTKLDPEKPNQFLPIVKEIESLNWSERTKGDAKKILIQFMKFLAGMRKSRPLGLEFIEIKKSRPFIDATKLLTFEDMKEIARKESNTMTKALLWFAFETGARSSELISIRVRDVQLNDHDLVHVRIPQTKTVARDFDIKDSKLSLVNWLLIHPQKDNQDAPLFVRKTNGKHEPLNEASLRNYLVGSCQRAGIKGKNTSPKWFRKAGICDWILRRKVDNPYMLMRLVGHSQINTAQAYIEFTGTQLTDYLKEKYGLSEKEELKDFNRCKLCGSLISPEDKVCLNCNYSPNTSFEDVRKKDIERVDKIEKQLERIFDFLQIAPKVYPKWVDAGSEIRTRGGRGPTA